MTDWMVCNVIGGYTAFDGNGCEIFFDSMNEAIFVVDYLNNLKVSGKSDTVDEHVEEASRLYKKETIINVVDLLDADNSTLHEDKGLHPKRKLKKKL